MNAMHKLEAAGFTRADIARALNVERQAVGHWARNRNAPSAACMEKLIELGAQRGVTFSASDFLPDRKAA